MRSYNINLSIQGGNSRGAFRGGNLYKSKGTLDSHMYQNQDNGEQVSQYNLRQIVNMGLVFNTLQKGNEVLGAFTNDRLRQRKINVGMTFAKYGIGLAVNPVAGATYMASDLAYRSIMYNVRVNKKNREAQYYKELSGNNSFSGRKYRGAYL